MLSELFQPARLISLNNANIGGDAVRDNYDFSNSIPNPYAKKLKKQITIRIDQDTIDYFKLMAEEKQVPYQSLINLYLRDCAQSNRQLNLSWS